MKRAMVVTAIASWSVAAVVWSLGWVSSLSALSLTAPEGESLGGALLKSAVVLASWFGAVMVAPVLLLSATTWTLIERAKARLRSQG